MGFNGGNHLADMGPHLREIHLRLGGCNAVGPRGAKDMGLLCRRYERLGGNAAIVEAVAAHLALFEQDDLLPELRRRGRNR